MKKLIIIILLVSIVDVSATTAIAEENGSDAGGEYAESLKEVVDLIEELERELYLTEKLFDIREGGGEDTIRAEAEPEKPLPDKGKERALIEENLILRSKVESLEKSVEETRSSLDEAAKDAKKPLEDKIISLERELERAAKERPAKVVNFSAKEEKEEKIERRAVDKEPSWGRDFFSNFFPVKRTESLAGEEGALIEGPKAARAEGESITVEREETISYKVDGLKRFLVLKPDYVDVSRRRDALSITGLKRGETFIHIWDEEGLRSVKVEVQYKNYKEIAKIREIRRKERQMRSFKVRYGLSANRIMSKSETASRAYQDNFYTHNLYVDGETPWGDLSSGLEYYIEEEGDAEMARDLANWNIRLNGEDLDIAVGNVGGYFSDVTLPGTGFQGFTFGNPDDKKIRYNVLWGTRGARMWGYKVHDVTDEPYFWGGKLTIDPLDYVTIYSSYAKTAENTDETAEYVYGSGITFKLLDNALRLQSEVGRARLEDTNTNSLAYNISGTLSLKDYNFLLKGIYRDIETDFTTVTGSDIPYAGKQGYYFDARYKPLDNLSLSGTYNLYRDRDNYNPSDAHAYNYDFYYNASYNIGNTDLRYSNWNSNSEGISSPGRTSGRSYGVSHFLELPDPLGITTFSLSYRPFQHKSLPSPSSDYKKKDYRASMRMNFLKNFYYDLSHDWLYKKYLESGESGTTRALGSNLGYSCNLSDIGLFGNFSAGYHKEMAVMENLPVSSGESYFSGRANLRYRPYPEVNTYLSVTYKKYRGELDHSKNRQETRISTGGTYNFDTTLRWGMGGSVAGYVFKDVNGNGVMDADEMGMGGVTVYAGRDRSTVTNESGRFAFGKMRDMTTTVMYDFKELPPGYTATSPNPVTLDVEKDTVVEAYFGIKVISEINGVVYNDINMNSQFDEDDEGVKGALVTLDDGTLAGTGPSGYYTMREAIPGKRTISLDIASIPFNLAGLEKLKRDITLEEGVEKRIDFPLYALRTVIGYVFLDSNGNRRFDSDEEGIEGVEVECAGVTGATDKDGRFFLKKLPGRRQTVRVKENTIPEGYGLSVSPTLTVNLATEGEVKEDVYFPLKKAR